MWRMGTEKLSNFSKFTQLRRDVGEVGPRRLGSRIHAFKHSAAQTETIKSRVMGGPGGPSTMAGR